MRAAVTQAAVGVGGPSGAHFNTPWECYNRNYLPTSSHFFSGQTGGIYRAPSEIGSVFCTTSHSARNLHISPAHVPLRKPTICTPFGPVQCHVPISAWDCHEQPPTRYDSPVLPMCIFACFTPHHQPQRPPQKIRPLQFPHPPGHI